MKKTMLLVVMLAGCSREAIKPEPIRVENTAPSACPYSSQKTSVRKWCQIDISTRRVITDFLFEASKENAGELQEALLAAQLELLKPEAQ